MKMIVLNGAPRSGKDTMLNVLRTAQDKGVFGSARLIPFSYKRVLCEGVAKRYGMTPQEVWDLNTNTDTKDLPDERFGGKSVRQALIYESEDVIKKEHGEDGVAIATFKRLQEDYGDDLNDAILVSPDGGFESEMVAAQNFFGISREDIFLIRMLRDGCTFKGDSRGYINNPNLTIDNDGTIRDLRSHLSTINAFIGSQYTNEDWENDKPF